MQPLPVPSHTTDWRKPHDQEQQLVATGRLYQKEKQAWVDMMRRCYDADHWNYHDYGGRGIKVCDRWQNRQHFLDDVAPAPSEQECGY